jgi:hypothetical protein
VITIEKNTISVNTITLKGELYYNGILLLTYKIEYPEFSSTVYRMPLKAINMLYKVKAMTFQKRCETTLFNQATDQYKNALENDFPFHAYDAVMTFNVTYLTSGVLSLYFDKYEYTGGAHGSTERDSQTYNLLRYSLVRLGQIVTCQPDYKTYILDEVTKQIEQDKSIYFENYAELAAETFNPNSFYLTPEGVVIYYQQYDIAPYSSGIREFLIPYSDCVKAPTMGN